MEFNNGANDMICCECGKRIIPNMPVYYVAKHFINPELFQSNPMCEDCFHKAVWKETGEITLSGKSTIIAKNWKKVYDLQRIEKEDG